MPKTKTREHTRSSRRPLWIIAAVAAAFGVAAAVLVTFEQRHGVVGQPTITVYKHPKCDCCNRWVVHLRDNGFTVVPKMELDWPGTRRRLGVPDSLAACHTAIVEGYVVEGHVPAEDIKRLLAERPKAKGLAVPGMPVGSPGMEQGDLKDPYAVMLFDNGADPTVFARH